MPSVTVQVDNVNYLISDTNILTASIASTSLTSGAVVLHDSVDYNSSTYIVTSIEQYAFHNLSNLTGSLTIPSSITIIGYAAFAFCSGFTGSLTIPNSVTSINSFAFNGCYGFDGSLTLSNSITSIGDGAFYNCYGFTGTLTIPSSVTIMGSDVFHLCSGFTGSLTIPSGITTIGYAMFAFCSGLTGSLTIPSNITSIGSFAFNGCNGFNGSLTLSNNITSIGDGAFYNCYGFTGTLTVPSSITSIGADVFNLCPNFTSVFIQNQSACTVQTSSFTNVISSEPPSQITFYYTAGSENLTGNWPTISGYYDTSNYDASCFNKGTKILCLNKQLEEEYIPIECLRQGDLVKSYKHGFRRIKQIGKNRMTNNPDVFHGCMYKMKKQKKTD